MSADGEATRVGIAGWYGYGNVGDDLILRALVARVQPALVFSTRPGEFEGIEILDVAELPSRAADLDLLLVGGGGLLNNRWLAQLPLADFSKPYGLLSVGIPHERWLTGLDEVVAAARFVTLRDHLACGRFADAYPGTPSWWLPDPGFTLRRRRVKKRALVALNPRSIPATWLREDDPPDSDDRQIALMAELVERFAGSAEFVGLGFENSDRELLARLPCESHVVELTEAIDVIARSAMLVTTRLHGGIIAATQGTHVALIDYQDKMRGLAELLGLALYPLEDLSQVADAVGAALHGPPAQDTSRPVAFGRLVERVLRLMTR